jgi:voltage-dependent calcium channel L type alpha-1D
MIFLNSMFLAVYDYNDRDENFLRNKTINVAGIIFTILFTIECVLKILAYGFVIHHKAYLRDGWNWIDFIVVIVGWIEQIPGIPSFRGLRTLRVLRPLRSINSIPSMKN